MIINLNKNENFEFKKIKTFREFVIRKNVSVDINFWKVNKSKILKEDNKNIGITINSDQSLDDFIEHLYIFKNLSIGNPEELEE